jgi:hypothetical protein
MISDLKAKNSGDQNFGHFLGKGVQCIAGDGEIRASTMYVVSP